MSVETGAVRGPLRRLTELVIAPDFYPERAIDNLTWAESVFEPIVLIGSTVCFILGVIHLGVAMVPDWPTRFLLPLSIVVGIEAFLYSRRLARGAVHFKEWLVLLAPIALLTRFLPYFDDPTSSVLGDLATWVTQPLQIFSLAFVIDSLLLFFCWCVVFGTTQLLNQLRVQPGEIVDVSDRASRFLNEDNIRAIDHGAPLRRIGELFVWGGVILVFISSLAALGMSQIFSIEAIGQILGFQRPSLHLVQLNVVIYFLFGLLLLGEAHFVRQRTLWRIDRLPMEPAITQRWVGGVVGLVVVAIVIAFILPTSYAMTLGDLISYVVSLAAMVMGAIGALLFYLFILIASLFGGHTDNTGSTPPATPPVIPHPTAPPAGPSPFETIQSIVFWVIAVGILLYSTSVIWRKRPAWLLTFSLMALLAGPWNILRSILRFGRQVGQDAARAISTLLPKLFRNPGINAPRRPAFISLSRLSPRELVEYFYLSVCERAAKLGHPRPAGVTPAEYERQLQSALPLVDPEIAAVTAAFLEARYGPRPTTSDQVRQVRAGWQTLKKKLRTARLIRGKSGGQA